LRITEIIGSIFIFAKHSGEDNTPCARQLLCRNVVMDSWMFLGGEKKKCGMFPYNGMRLREVVTDI
jgi:hypothetical protein